MSVAHIRMRPGMYVGSTDGRGLHRLLRELLLVPLHHVRTGKATRVEVDLLADGGCTLHDDGPGAPVEKRTTDGRGWLEAALTTRWGPPGYSPPSDDPVFDSLELTCANALSSRCVAEVRRNGRAWRQVFHRGEPQGPIEPLGLTTTSGVTFSFWPDPEIFPGPPPFCQASVRRWLFELSCLNPSATFRLRDLRGPRLFDETIREPGGLVALLDSRCGALGAVHPTTIQGSQDTPPAGTVQVALRWCPGQDSRIFGYVNDRPVQEGTHISGLRAGLRQAMRSSDSTPQSWAPGLLACIHVRIPEAQFNGATRQFLANPEVVGWVAGVTRRAVRAFLRLRPDEAEAIHRHLLDPEEVDPKSGMTR